MSIKGNRWQVTAEHSCGQDTGHPCRTGAVDDPADLLDETITAGDYDEALKAGAIALDKIMEDFKPCTCGRQDMAGADGWWNSVTINAERVGVDEEPTETQCPRCGNPAALTTEWGWIDDETCTATLACPDCRTEPAYHSALVHCVHRPCGEDEEKLECEEAAASQVELEGFVDYDDPATSGGAA